MPHTTQKGKLCKNQIVTSAQSRTISGGKNHFKKKYEYIMYTWKVLCPNIFNSNLIKLFLFI
jgi:hypothetical protein